MIHMYCAADWLAVQSQAEVEDTLERIKLHKGVEAVLIVNSEGIPIRPAKGMPSISSSDCAAHYAPGIRLH